MIVIVGLVIVVAAVVAGVAGVLTNSGQAHALPHGFAVFGYHVTGSTGTLFLYGIVVGAIGVAGLSLLLAGARRTSRRGSEARRGLRQSRRETTAVSQDRDELIGQRDTARAYTASSLGSDAPGNGSSGSSTDARPRGRRSAWSRLFGGRPATRPVAATAPDSSSAQPGPAAPADAPAPAAASASGKRP